MHPHIRQNEPGKCPICGMDLVPLSQLSGSTNEYQLEMTPEAMALSNVMTTKVTSGASASRLQLSGKIQPDEQRIKSLTSNFAGRIDKLFVNFIGQEVTKGQKLATIYSPDLVNAQRELLEVAKIKDRQPALYQAAKEKLRLWKISEGQIGEIEKSGAVQTQFDVFADAQLSGKYSMMLRPESKAVSQNQDVPEQFRKQLTAFVKSYFTIKNAHTASDIASAQSSVSKSKASLTKVEMGLLDEKSHEVWMGLLKPIQGSLDKIQSTKDVEVQRSHFETLSDNLISAVAYFGVEENTVYKQYCPMAFKDKGAFWLSGEKEIKNPYFGEAMLTCGEVKETFQPIDLN